jgi:steroid delta-isomerase-like uncharacterized protein
MTGEEMKLLAKRFYEEAFNERRFEVADELIADDYVEHEEFPGAPKDKGAVRFFLDTVTGAFPDAMITIEDSAAEGDRLWLRYRLKGTHEGEFMGIPATGKSIDVQGLDIVRIRDGKAVEHWGISDDLKMLQQLGVIPEEVA